MQRAIPPDRLALVKEGIPEAQVEVLRLKYGDNRIAEHRAKSTREIVGDAAGDPMLWFLASTAGLFALLGQAADAAVLLLALVPLIAMDIYLHSRTEASLKGLRSVLAASARVIRDGRERTLPAADLVPGDCVRIGAGDTFPADGVILQGEDLQVDESSVTGEAYPVVKLPLGCSEADEPGESVWALAGTRLLTGNALMGIVFIGRDTLYGEIVQAATTTRRARTPLQQAVAALVRKLLAVALGACLILATVRLVQGHGLLDAFLSAAVLAVAAIPEEFPVVLTFFLGVGVYRLAQRRALVRQAVAVENIGRVSVICSDKTGTITEGRLTLHGLYPAPGFSRDRLLELGRMASRVASHDPLDAALIATGDGPPGVGQVSSFPFTEARRREVAIWEGIGGLTAAVKGAPETVLGLCDLDAEEAARIVEHVRALSSGGQKVIACASRPVPDASTEPLGGFQFAGLIGIADPLREGVPEAVQAARGGGIRLIMVTGDHPQTAVAIAREMGLAAEPVVLTGDDLAHRLRAGERAFLDTLDAVARATPAQKVLLVEALRDGGRITAVTGDGINDVPALKAADVGIAMGMRGTRSAREVAAIILLDDNFSTIVRAIAEGRQLSRNLVRSFAYLLMVHIPLVSTAAVVPLLGYPLLYLPVHIVFLELIIHPAAILGFQQPAGGGLTRHAAGPRGFFTRPQAAAIVCTGSAVALAVGALFMFTIDRGESVEHARAVALIGLTSGMVATFAALTRLTGTAAKVVAASALLTVLGASCVPALAAIVHMHALGVAELAGACLVGAVTALPSLLYLKASAPRPANDAPA